MEWLVERRVGDILGGSDLLTRLELGMESGCQGVVVSLNKFLFALRSREAFCIRGGLGYLRLGSMDEGTLIDTYGRF